MESQAILFLSKGELEKAEKIYRHLISSKIINTDILNNLAAILGKQRKFDEAIDIIHAALELDPTDPDAYFNLGNAFKEKGNVKAAIDAYKITLDLNPADSSAHSSLGNVLRQDGRLEAAIASYTNALEIKPNYPDAIADLSHCLLTLNRYPEGWEKYEWRNKREEPSVPQAKPQSKRWNGEIPIKEIRNLLLVCEQGLGDTLQFMRYAIALQDRGICVSLCAQKQPHSLINTSGIHYSPLTPEQASQVTEGEWIPLLSVPRSLEVTPANPIITEP